MFRKDGKIGIIGGAGALGSWFARMFKQSGFDMRISDIDKAKGIKIAKSIGITYKENNLICVKDVDIIIISVPIEQTIKVIREVAPHLKKDALLMDLTSVKREPVNTMKEYSAKGVEIIGCHPMFGPTASNLRGQVIILTPINSPKSLHGVVDFFESNGARIVITNPERHDEIMSIVQGLTHFMYIAAASTLHKLNIDMRETKNFMSPIYEIMIDLIARIVGQNPYLYAQIQMSNENITRVHEAFIEESRKLAKSIKDKNVNSFTKTMEDAAMHMGYFEEAMRKTNKLIQVLREK